MQKHQWRQHGIGHYKSRPNGSDGPTLGIIGAEGVLYNSYLERGTKTEAEEQQETKFAPVCQVPEAAANTEVENFSEDEDVEGESSQSISRVVTTFITDSQSQEENKKSLEVLRLSLYDSGAESGVVCHDIDNNNLHHPPPPAQPQPQPQPPPSEPEDSTAKPPLKLKMKLAQAYLKEVKESREREEADSRDNEGRDSFAPLPTVLSLEENMMNHCKLSKAAAQPVEPQVASQSSEYVECLCKSCGRKCLVSDPYNFSCGHCQVKYTSLPTHMIADPLQCIGCLQIFQHKPAMKEHQCSNDKERPFVCCKCGYEFKQKAHLQKHQWRIHRRKLEPDPNIKEAEAILKAVNEISAPSSSGQAGQRSQEPENKMSIQQIIDRGIEEEMRRGESGGNSPLDLSPCKMYGSPSSITQWVQQVETARTPIVPDISIHAAPPVELQLPREPLQLSQLRGPSSECVSVTIQLLEPHPPHPSHPPHPQTTKHYAVKSKPGVPTNLDPAGNCSWRNRERDNNPLLNQKAGQEEPGQTSQVLFLDRGHKRVRTHLTDLSPQSRPADLSINQNLDLPRPPLPPLPPLSPPSPPLNLSAKHLGQTDDLPFDYRISRSDLITGQLARMRSQDERSGI